MKEMHPDALPSIVESVNEATYRRIEGLHRGPPILMALADGEVWTTRELARFHPPGKDRTYATHHMLLGYEAKGLVERVSDRRSHSRKVIHPELPLVGRVDKHELAALLDVHRSTIWLMRKLGRLPPPTSICPGHWCTWDVDELRRFFRRTGGFVRLYTFRVQAWRMTAEGLERAKGKRR